MTTESTPSMSASSPLDARPDDRTGQALDSTGSGPPTSASEHTDAGEHAGAGEHTEELQSRAREFLHLLHRMPMASSKKQLAIRLLVKVVRLATSVDVRPDPSSAFQDPENRHTPPGNQTDARNDNTASLNDEGSARSPDSGSTPHQPDDAGAAPAQTVYRNVVGI